MKTFFISSLSSLIAILAIDSVWLYIMSKKFYQPNIGHLMADKVNFIPAIFFYLLYVSAISFFVVIPAFKNNYSPINIFLVGAFLGLLAYGTYDLTNHSTLKDWPTIVTLVDLVWGALLTGSVSLIAYYTLKYFS
jgi:uncharacterized membrane protein